MLALTPCPARDFLAGLGETIGRRPAAILVVSAHWETDRPAVSAAARNETIHDFYGFPPELYRLTYPAPGSAAVAERVAALLAEAGFEPLLDHRRGLDHGAWVPLLLAYPEADVPVLQLSLQTALGPAHHFALGRALAPLRDERILVVGSGSFTHNLREMRGHGIEDAAPEWVTAFADWMDAALVGGWTEDLLAYRRLAPFAARNHPTEEHLLPLFVALGAAGPSPPRVERLHASATYSVLRMDAYRFD
jgi:4,5-DOPA dioxygenase extradiol